MKFEFLTRANAGALSTLCTGDKPEFAAANSKREEWLDGMFRQGLRGWVAFQDGVPAGYVEYLPIEIAPFPVVGRNAHFLTCLWVPPKFQHQGVGGSLLAACVGDSSQGIVTYAYHGEHKPIEFFLRFGFREVQQAEGASLLTYGNPEVEFQHSYYQAHESNDQLAVDVLYNPECPWSTRTAERFVDTIKAHPAFPQVKLWVGNAWEHGMHLGLHGGIYLNGVKAFSTPPTQDEINQAIEQALTVRVPFDS